MKQILILAAVLYLAACNNTESAKTAESTYETTETENKAPEDSVETDAISAATNVVNEPSFNGIFIVPPQQQATITLTIGGIIRSTSVIEGQFVEKGEIIATLDNPEFIELQQNYLDATAQLEYLEKEYIRQQNLASQEAASQKQLQLSKANFLSVKSKAESMSAQLSLLGIEAQQLKDKGFINRLEIKAPISGYVTNTNVNVGKYINPGEALCDIIDKSNLLLQLTTYEKDLSKLSVGNRIEFKVNGMGEETFEAVLLSIDQTVDMGNRSIKVFAKLKDYNKSFLPGMYVSAKIKEN